MDERNVEDIDTSTEDHQYAEACHLCMYRPLAQKTEKPRLSQHDKRIDALKKGQVGTFEHIATIEQERALQNLWRSEEDDFGEVDQMRDWTLKPTIM